MFLPHIVKYFGLKKQNEGIRAERPKTTQQNNNNNNNNNALRVVSENWDEWIEFILITIGLWQSLVSTFNERSVSFSKKSGNLLTA
jgi:hypothetical protein